MTHVSNVNGGSTGITSDIVITAPRPAHRGTFSELLSELNPLQYLPVVGTIYRALTGDRISEEARTVGSLVMSGITGGPAGLAISAAAMAVEKLVGIDPEQLGQTVLAEAGLGKRHPNASPAAAPTLQIVERPSSGTPVHEVTSRAHAGAWSQEQMLAYGVNTIDHGSSKHGSLQGSDVLNDMELARLAQAKR